MPTTPLRVRLPKAASIKSPIANGPHLVVARFRPQNRTEIESGGEPIVAFETEDTCNLNVSIVPVDARWISSSRGSC